MTSSRRRWLLPVLLAIVLLAVVTASDPIGGSATSVPQPTEEWAAAGILDRDRELPSRGGAQRHDDPVREAMELTEAVETPPSPSSEPRYISRVQAPRQSPKPEPPPAPPQEAPGPQAPSVPGSCGSYSGNRATGCAMLLEAGFSLDQMGCLDALWTRESGWNELAQNPSSGAYGIPQSLPGDKMASHGSDWRTNPVTQINWGLDYIAGRYGTPCAAWGHSQDVGWY